MPKKRVHEIAKEQGITSKEVLAAFKDAGVYVKAASSTVEERDIRRAFPNGPVKVTEPEPAKAADEAPAPKETAPKETADRDADGRATGRRPPRRRLQGRRPIAMPTAGRRCRPRRRPSARRKRRLRRPPQRLRLR